MIEVPVVRVFTRHGQRMVAVGPCPYCAGAHEHLWRPDDQEPGSRQAPCTKFDPRRYEMVLR